MQAVSPAMELVRIKKEAASILTRHGLTLPFDPVEFNVTASNIYEPCSCTSISTQLLDSVFPKTGPTEVLHFTRPEVLPSLLEYKSLWLASIIKRLDEGEYIRFAEEHGYASANSKKIRKDLAQNYFYTSFTAVGSASAATHWNDFSAQGSGFCLRFSLTPNSADLRNIQYQTNAKTLLTRIDEELKASIGRTFFPRGIARLSAFYLGQDLAYEDEIRLMVSNPQAVTKFMHRGYEYVAIRLEFDNPWCAVRLSSITCGNAGDEQYVRRLTQRFGFDHITIHAR